MRRKAGNRKSIVWLLVAALTIGTLTGCGADADDGTGSGVAGSDSAGQEGEQGTARGRYVEKDVELNGNDLTDWNSRVVEMEDGSLLLTDNSGFALRSRDNGANWSEETPAWLAKMKEDNKYIRDMAVGPDGTAAVIWTVPIDQGGEGGNGVQLSLNMQLTVVKPDGTEVQVETRLASDDFWLDTVYVSDTGRILVNASGSTLYEVKEDGSFEKLLNIGEGSPDLFRLHNNLLLLDGAGYESPLIYDVEAKTYIEDEVLADFVKENFSDRSLSRGRSYDLFEFFGGDDVIYLAGKQGVYRHVLGGSAMEQIIDGSLCVLGNPAYSIMDMMAVKDNEFVVLFTPGKVAHLVYDPDVPARPDKKLKVWGLEDKAAIRQAIDLYQKAHPEAYVEYEVGLEQGSVMTREDVIKNLNTHLMAGEGPDVLILDDMPTDSYIEKGILLDLSPALDGMSGEEAPFPNVVEAFRNDGKIYMMPCEMQLPYLLGRNSDLQKMTDLSGIADAMEKMREANPGESLLLLPSEKGIMRMFSMASAPAWKTEGGTIDRDAISDFLTQSKRIYDAEMDGLSEKAMDEWESLRGVYQAYDSVHGEELEDSDALRAHHDQIYLMGNLRQFVPGSIGDVTAYNISTSIFVTEGFEDCKAIPMSGQCSNVFWAQTLLGINATSENTEMAQEFLQAALGNEVQAKLQDGISVNKKAILDNYANQWRIYKDNDYVSGGGSLYTDDGKDITLVIRIPDEAKVNALLQWIETLDTAYVEDSTFESVVYEEGIYFMRGDKSLEEAMDSIEARLGIYLAE
ncbi:MAG: carbohydrate ABC transporter substrate-binding protein [Lachnospiraceae bacterium]|nr:carbohydrate ABC transporter substrate-binding protein [Lachnospiraceae bacterium]